MHRRLADILGAISVSSIRLFSHAFFDKLKRRLICLYGQMMRAVAKIFFNGLVREWELGNAL